MAIEITKEEIIELNKKIVEEFGGTIGLINESNLDFVLAKVKNAKDIFKKAAELVYGINIGHVFIDVNKRTAFEAAKIFLLANDIEMRTDEEAEEFMIKMAQPEKLSIKEVEIWIKQHSEKYGKEKD
jgi:death-on-curing protein